MTDDIDTPLKGVSYCNKHMRKCEEGAEKAMLAGDLQIQAKFEGHLVKWTELLQYYLRQAYQQGDTKEELAKKVAEKKRYNASPSQ